MYDMYGGEAGKRKRWWYEKHIRRGKTSKTYVSVVWISIYEPASNLLNETNWQGIICQLIR